jgi:hypothetical protein
MFSHVLMCVCVHVCVDVLSCAHMCVCVCVHVCVVVPRTSVRSTLLMMSPFYAAMLSCLFLGEPWLCVEYVGALMSFTGESD